MRDLQRVLDAAVKQLANGKKAPHCYSAWVQGQGYVNDGSAAFDRADYLRQLERDARSEVENMGFASAYAEKGYTQPANGILWANWNKLPTGFDRVLERLGYAVEWSDEWTSCDDCQKAIRTEPDGYDWKPAYHMTDGEILCSACWQEAHSEEDEDDNEVNA